MDTAEQLKFIVDFANMDLQGGVREGDWLNLQEDFSRFFPFSTPKKPVVWDSPGSIHYDPRGDPEWEKYAKQKLESVQSELRTLLSTKAPPKGVIRAMTVEINVYYGYLSGGWLIAMGKARDLFLQRVIELLLDPEASSRIRQCSACKKFFLRVRRQIHCSPQCADKANYQKKKKAEGEEMAKKSDSKKKRRRK